MRTVYGSTNGDDDEHGFLRTALNLAKGKEKRKNQRFVGNLRSPKEDEEGTLESGKTVKNGKRVGDWKRKAFVFGNLEEGKGKGNDGE